MGMYPADCKVCGKSFTWFSGNTHYSSICPGCREPAPHPIRKAKIKGEWVEYDYAIDSLLTTKDLVIECVKRDTGLDMEFLGRSKAVMDELGQITQLKKRTMFFKFV